MQRLILQARFESDTKKYKMINEVDFPNFRGPDFSGITYFNLIDLEKKSMVRKDWGVEGENGWECGEYCKRNGQFRYTAKIDGKIIRFWVDTRINDIFSLNASNPDDEETEPVLARLAEMEKGGNLGKIKWGEGYGESKRRLDLIKQRGALSWETLEKGKIYLRNTASREESILYRHDKVVSEPQGNLQIVRVFGQIMNEFHNSLGIKINSHGVAELMNPLAYKSTSIGGNTWDQKTSKWDFRDWAFYPANEADIDLFLMYRKTEFDNSVGRELTREGRCIFCSLQALQFTHWGVYQQEGPYKENSEVNPTNYQRAIDTIISRFGQENFTKETTKLIKNYYKSLDGEPYQRGSPYKLHSDIPPLDFNEMHLAVEVLKNNKYPFPRSMGDWGHLVNALPIFGDVFFWKSIRTKYPVVFNKIVDFIQSLPSEFEQHGTYGDTAIIEPIGIIETYFPEAYREITKSRKEFKSKRQPAFRLTKKG